VRVAITVLVLGLFLGCSSRPDSGLKPNAQGEVRLVALYSGVEGVCLSLSGDKYGKFERYLDREEVLLVTDIEMDQIISELKKTGFLNDVSRSLEVQGSIPPLAYTLCVKERGEIKELVFWHVKGSEIPEYYLSPFARIQARSDVLERIIANNVKLK